MCCVDATGDREMKQLRTPGTRYSNSLYNELAFGNPLQDSSTRSVHAVHSMHAPRRRLRAPRAPRAPPALRVPRANEPSTLMKCSA